MIILNQRTCVEFGIWPVAAIEYIEGPLIRIIIYCPDYEPPYKNWSIEKFPVYSAMIEQWVAPD